MRISIINSPTIYNTTFIASIKPEYANYGVNGYVIGATTFRSAASLKAALDTAFAKDLGDYRHLEVQIEFNIGTEKRNALCTAETYEDVLEAIADELEMEKLTLDDLLEE